MKKKITVGLIEPVTVYGKKRAVKTLAKFDTGASKSSIDQKLAEKLVLGPVVKFIKIKSASTESGTRRPVYSVKIEIKGKKIPVNINTAKRGHMRYKILIGRDVLHSNFIVDVALNNNSAEEGDLKID